MPVVLDANVYVSALNFGGKPKRVLDKANAREFEIAISQPILDEVIRVLRDKFLWEPDKILEAQALIGSISQHVTPTEVLDVAPSDPDDNRILECAVEARSETVVSGDGDLLRLGKYRNISIITVAAFLQTLPADNEGPKVLDDESVPVDGEAAAGESEDLPAEDEGSPAGS